MTHLPTSQPSVDYKEAFDTSTLPAPIYCEIIEIHNETIFENPGIDNNTRNLEDTWKRNNITITEINSADNEYVICLADNNGIADNNTTNSMTIRLKAIFASIICTITLMVTFLFCSGIYYVYPILLLVNNTTALNLNITDISDNLSTTSLNNRDQVSLWFNITINLTHSVTHENNTMIFDNNNPITKSMKPMYMKNYSKVTSKQNCKRECCRNYISQ